MKKTNNHESIAPSKSAALQTESALKREFMALTNEENDEGIAGRIRYDARRNAFYITYANSDDRDWLKLSDVFALIARDDVVFLSKNDRRMFVEKISECQDVANRRKNIRRRAALVAIPTTVGLTALAIGAASIAFYGKRNK